MSEPRIRNADGSEELLRFFQEKSDDIECVYVGNGQPFSMVDPTTGATDPVVGYMLVLLCCGEYFCVARKDHAELILNVGILTRMKIRIELNSIYPI
jgi:hypothetical protein